MTKSTVIVLIADGLTPAALDEAIRAGDVPELAAWSETGQHSVVSTVFPSVTGVAYIPMLTGHHPAQAGIPGLRWFDRARQLPALLGHARSYVGMQVRRMNADLSLAAPTLFERVDGEALGAASMITRGLPRRNQLDRGLRYAARVTRAHLTGDVARWTALEEELAETLILRIRKERPRFVFAAFTAGDKAAHAGGVSAPGVRQSLKLIDHVVGSIRRDAERDGRWDAMHLWMLSDHGHSAVEQHFELSAALRDTGVSVRSHPFTLPDRAEAAVMVSGNSMAHVYLGLGARARSSGQDLSKEWLPRISDVLSHRAIDLVASRRAADSVTVRRGSDCAEIAVGPRGFSYRTATGNPLGLEPFEDLCDAAAHDRCAGTEYPDGVVQLALLVLAQRSGDLVISAAPGWDLRQRYEPIDHVSSHGALHAAHMLVPLSGSRRLTQRPRRTADLFPVMLDALGIGDELGDRRGSPATLAGARTGARGG